jgi:hypothetical protein
MTTSSNPRRFPGVKLVWREGGIGWLPAALERADRQWERHKYRNDMDDIGPMRAMAGASYPTPLVDPKRTNDELSITLTPVRAGVEKTVAWLHEQGRI